VLKVVKIYLQIQMKMEQSFAKNILKKNKIEYELSKDPSQMHKINNK
jgi:hypothetical protein